MNAPLTLQTPRSATVLRETRETRIEATLVLEGSGQATISTGIGFLDHLLTALTRHAGFDLELSCAGDLEVDDHHSAEDCALVLGQALDEALGERRGIERFGDALVPMDEALARAAVDLGGRPWAEVELALQREALGGLACENVRHFVISFATAARAAIHLDVLRGRNDHHKAEGAFKALARALKSAVRRSGDPAQVPSTKGVL